MIEVELYRQTADAAKGRVITSLDAHDDWFLKKGTTAAALTHCLVGSMIVGTRRVGKLLLLDVAHSSEQDASINTVLGLRFGMTGRLIVDGVAGIDELLYSSHRPDAAFTRFAMTFTDGGRLEISDPRRLGGVILDPDTSRMGIDALSLSVSDLALSLAGSNTPLKARLLDQSRIAGVGNLIADETLWQAKLKPTRTAGSLTVGDVQTLHRVLLSTIADLTERGGSHLGDLMASRERGSMCPRCANPLVRETVGGRTTYWCVSEQL
jgi:formamidopyrimidine-DNA glycosylase